MKNKFCLLLLAAVLGASPVRAAEWEYGFSGSVSGLYGYSNVAEKFSAYNSHNHGVGDAELEAYAKYIFDGEIEAGLYMDLMFGLNHELEDYNQGKWGEEVYAIVDGPAGRLMAGQTFNAAYQFHVGAPEAGLLGPDNVDVVDFIRNPNWKRRGREAKFATLNSTAINTDGVAAKLTYITPEFYNTMLGFSYVPDSYNRRGLVNKDAPYHNKEGYVFSAYNYLDLGFAEMTTSLGYAEFVDIDKEFSAGLSLSRGNWTLGGSWRKTYAEDGDVPLNRKVSDNTPEFFDGYREGYAWDVGLGYEIGPYKASLSYFKSVAENSDNQDEIIAFSNRYQYNKYMDVYLTAAHVNFEGDTAAVADNNRGYAFVAGLSLNF